MSDPIPREIVCLTSATNPVEAHLLQQALQEEGINAQVLGDYLEGGIGNIPGVSAEVWVDAANLEQAQAILQEHFEHPVVPEDIDDTESVST